MPKADCRTAPTKLSSAQNSVEGRGEATWRKKESSVSATLFNNA
jgi:hypothetical protein